MRGRANTADCGRAAVQMRRETRNLLRYAEGIEGSAHINQAQMQAGCAFFWAKRGIKPERVTFGENDFRRSA